MADGSFRIISERIYTRLREYRQQAEIPIGKLKIKFLTSPLGLPNKQPLQAALDENIATIDSFAVCDHQTSACTVEEATPADVAVAQQWLPHGTPTWDFLLREFVRVELSGDVDAPIFTLCGKYHDGGAESADAEDPAIGFAENFFHCFPGLLVEGTIEECVSSGRYALQIRGESATLPALFIDNGRPRPGYEDLVCCFDSEAASFFEGKSRSPHFVLRNPDRPRALKSTACLGTFGATREHVLQAGEPIFFHFVRPSEMILQERRAPRIVKNKVRHLPRG